MGEERRAGMDDLIFKVGEIHAKTECIPDLQSKVENLDKRITINKRKAKTANAITSGLGGIIGGFLAVVGHKLTIG